MTKQAKAFNHINKETPVLSNDDLCLRLLKALLKVDDEIEASEAHLLWKCPLREHCGQHVISI